MRTPRLDPLTSRADAAGPSGFVRPAPLEAMAAPPPDRLELPARPAWDTAAPHGSARQSLAGERVLGPPRCGAVHSTGPACPDQVQGLTDASVEDAVRRVLVRMTDDLVRRLIVETAERLIREEIEKIKLGTVAGSGGRSVGSGPCVHVRPILGRYARSYRNERRT